MGQGGNSFFTLCGRVGKEREDPFLFRWVIRKKDGFAFGLVKRKKVFVVFTFDLTVKLRNKLNRCNRYAIILIYICKEVKG